LLEADENIEPVLAAPPPPFWCSMHGWVICPLHEYGTAASPTEEASLPSPTTSTVGLGARGQSPTSVFEFGGASSAAAPEADSIASRAPSPTPTVVEIRPGAPPMELPPSVSRLPGAPRVLVSADDALAFVSAPTGASSFVFGSGAASVDAAAPMRPLSPTPVTLPSPRAEVRRRLAALGLPLSSPASASPSSSRGRRSGTWSPATLELPNGRADDVVPSARLPGDSSDEGIRGGSSSGRR
jgi:hypothetical protein